MIVERVRYGSRGQGSLVKYDDSPNWFSAYYVHGKEHRESTGTPDLKKARSWHKAKLDEIGAARRGLTHVTTPAAKRVTAGELLDALKSDYRLRGVESPQVRSHMKPIRAHFGTWRASDTTSEAVDAYIESRLETDTGRATINRETQLLGQAFRLAFERHRITAIPSIRHLPEENARQGFFERPEFEAVVTALSEYLQDFTRFAYLTGWRKGEIISLRWSDVDGGAIRLRPEHSKNGRGRVVPFDVLPQLATLMKRRETARLMETPAGEPRIAEWVFHHEGDPIGDFRKAWATACIAVGLYHVEKAPDGTERKVHEKLFHDLRRTAVRNMVRAGVDPVVAMKISGHRTRSIFDRYNIVDEADLRDGMQKVGRYVDTLPTTRQETSVPTERGENAESAR